MRGRAVPRRWSGSKYPTAMAPSPSDYSGWIPRRTWRQCPSVWPRRKAFLSRKHTLAQLAGLPGRSRSTATASAWSSAGRNTTGPVLHRASDRSRNQATFEGSCSRPGPSRVLERVCPRGGQRLPHHHADWSAPPPAAAASASTVEVVRDGASGGAVAITVDERGGLFQAPCPLAIPPRPHSAPKCSTSCSRATGR